MDDLRINSVERKKQVFISVNGKRIAAYEGETLISVLIASGIKKMRKSSVLNEPRGGLCGMGVCYDCLITLDGVPNVRACMSYIKSGMEINTNE